MTEQQRSKRDRIERLRERLRAVILRSENEQRMMDVIKGILDLLADEL